MKNKNNLLLLLVGTMLTLWSCSTTKDVAYMQDLKEIAQNASKQAFDPLIAPKDLVTVTINTTRQELAAPFNGLYWNPNYQYSNQSQQLRQYLVSNDGTIDLPVLGRVKVGGLTVQQAETMLKERLTAYLTENPNVNVQIVNYRYSVLGEVNRPGSFVSTNGKVTVFDALAEAGDMTIYGIRDEVKLYRESATGEQSIVTLNLKDANLIHSPYFYLRQGDVLYVQPNNAKASSAQVSAGVTVWFSVFSIGFSLANLLATLLRK